MTKRKLSKTKRQRYVLIPLRYVLILLLLFCISTNIKDGNMDAIFYSQYAWTDNMIEVPNKIIINNIFTPFMVSLHIHLTDILIKEALTDSPLLIIKENINCGNFLNVDRFNFLIDRINYNPLTDFPINKRLYKETLFHIPSQNEIYTNREMICLQHFYNIFITNPKWQVVTSCYCWDKKVILLLVSNSNQ